MANLHLLRYSPVNGMIVNWNYNGVLFNDCGLPSPIEECSKINPETQCCAKGLAPIEELVDTYGWARWLPEVIVGVNDPNEEIAANYVRQAAIDFSKRSMVLQRKTYVMLQKDIITYPLTPAPGEKIIGILALIDQNRRCWRVDNNFINFTTGDFSFNQSRSEVTVNTRRQCGVLELICWSAPSEDACIHDVYLYDFFRKEISYEARMRYVSANHFRDKQLMATMQPTAQFTRDINIARTNATKWLNRGIDKTPQSIY